MLSPLARKLLSPLFVLAVMASVQPQSAFAQGDPEAQFALRTGYADLQADGTTVYANSAGEWAADDYDHLWNFSSAYVVYGLSVNGGDVLGGEMSGPQVWDISLDPENPTIVPISWTYSLASYPPGVYTVRFYSWAVGGNGFDHPYWADGFSLTIQVTVP